MKISNKINIPIPLHVDTIFPLLSPPPVFNSNASFIFSLFGCYERVQNKFWNLLKIKSPQQAKPGKISCTTPTMLSLND